MPRPRPPELDNAGWLRQRYVTDCASLAVIAAECDCDVRTVARALRRSGIPTRTHSEAGRVRPDPTEEARASRAAAQRARRQREREEHQQALEQLHADMAKRRAEMNGATPTEAMGALLAIGSQRRMAFDDAWKLARELALQRRKGKDRADWADVLSSVQNSRHGWRNSYNDEGPRLRLDLSMINPEPYDERRGYLIA
jgi:hypothetical protein